MPSPDVLTSYFIWDNTSSPFRNRQPAAGSGDSRRASPTRAKPNTPKQPDLNKLCPLLIPPVRNYYNASEVQLEEKFQMPSVSQGLSPGVQKQYQLNYSPPPPLAV